MAKKVAAASSSLWTEVHPDTQYKFLHTIRELKAPYAKRSVSFNKKLHFKSLVYLHVRPLNVFMQV